MKSMRKKSMKKRSMRKRKSMKKRSMRKRAMKVSIIGRGRMAKSQVFKGRKVKTVGGLKKTDLKKNKYGKVVSKKASARASTGKTAKWTRAVVAARKALGVKGFRPIGGKSAAGQALLKKVRSFYKK